MGSKSGGCNSSTRENSDMNKSINNNKDEENGEKKLDYWRKYFRNSNYDIFNIIENAIKVAAIDCPKEFRIRKVKLAELLFSCRMTRCIGCDRIELVTSHDHDHVHNDDHDHGDGSGGGGDDDGHGGDLSKGSKVDSTSKDVVNDDGDADDDDDVEIDIGGGVCGGGGVVEVDIGGGGGVEIGFNDDVEGLIDLIEEEKELIIEVLRIKDVLYNSQDESDSVLYESLRRLQLMHLTINILKETEIGKAVNSIRRHSSKDIRHLARSLIDGWKIIVDEWVKATQELAEGGTPDSINPSTVEEEEGLPSPPLDDGVFSFTETIDFNQFFDGMDDDGNPRNSGEFNKNRNSVGNPSAVKPDAPKRREEPRKEATPITKDNRAQQMKMHQQPLSKPSKPLHPKSGPGRQLNPKRDFKLPKDSTAQPKVERPVVQRKPAPQPEKPKHLTEEDLVQNKLEASKRKLQESYQQAQNAKKQRTIQVMEIHDLPKQGVVNKNFHGRFGNHNRNWGNGRK